MDPLGRLHTFCHAAPGLWHVMGVTNGAGLSLRWFRDTFAPGTRPTTTSPPPPHKIPAGSDGLLWAPYLFGERTPHLDPNARAAFVGITASHTRAHFVRAVLEGVAFSLQDTFTLFAELGIPVNAHPSRRRRRARPALAPDPGRRLRPRPSNCLAAEEGGAFGAALLAGVGATLAHLEAACAAGITVAETIHPKPDLVRRYAQGYAGFRKVYPALKGIRG